MKPPCDQPCVICIEDEQVLLSDLVEELTAAGYRVLAAASADDALRLIDTEQPDLVLCDVMLGSDAGRDGYFIHDHLRRQRPDLAATPFIFLTALGHRSHLLQAKLDGIDDYLVKPVDYAMLLATVRARLNQVERLRSLQPNPQDAALDHLRGVFSQLPGAVLLCDEKHRVLYANPRAQALSERGLWRCGGDRRLWWPGAERASWQAIQACIKELCELPVGERRVTALASSNGMEQVLVSLLRLDLPSAAPGEALLALFICSAQLRPLPDLDNLRLMFRLTPTEARVALLLAQGCRTEDVAQKLDVSASTVAFHLRNLFAKTGVTRQTDIVALVLAAGWSIPDLAALDSVV